MKEGSRENAARFLAVARNMSDGVLLMDPSGSILFANDEAARIFGREPAELVGGLAAELFERQDGGGELPAPDRLMETVRGDRSQRVEVTGLRTDGTTLPLTVTYSRYEEDGDPFFTCVMRDMSERQRTETKLRFQARLLDAVGEAVIATDPAGRITYWNAAAEELYGWRSDEVMGRPIDEVTPAEVARAHAVEIMRRLKRGESWTGEFMVQDREGRAFPVLVTDSPVMDEGGSLIGIIGTSKEITSRKRVEEAQRFLAESGRVLASSLDHQTTLSRVSRLAVPMLGDWCLVHLVEDRRGPVPVAHCAPTGRDEDVPLLEAVLAGRSGILGQVLPASDPVRIPADDSLLPEAAADLLHSVEIDELLIVPLAVRGEPLGVMTFARSTTERSYDREDVRLAAELALRAASAIENARLYREAEQSDRAKTDFLAVVSHELRTPLNAITGYAELLTGGVSGPLNDKQMGQLERIRVSARHLAQLIDEILTYARMEGGRDRVDAARADIGEIVREAVSVLQPEAQSRGLDLTFEGPDQGPEQDTDAGKLRQIMVNLVSNAVKYTDEGSVTVAIQQAPGGIMLSVTDTGVGIPSEQQDRIFEPFRQVQSPNTRTVGGTGLGLSVSRRLAQLLGGDIRVESEPGEGSTFTVWLPSELPGEKR